MKRSAILLICFIVLLGIYWLVQSKKPVVSADRPFVPYDSAAVDMLRIESSLDTVELRKQGTQWMVVKPVNYPAAQKTVESALAKFKDMKKLTLISTKTDRQAEFQVDAAGGTKVILGEGGKSYPIVLGKSGSNASTTFARQDGSNEIWEIGGSLTSTFKRKAKDWRDKTVTEYNLADFRKVTLNYPNQTITATSADSIWKIDDGKKSFETPKSVVERLTNLLARMSTVDFADSLPSNAFDHPTLQLTAEISTGQDLDLKLIPKDPDSSQYYLRKAGSTTDFIIYKSTANVLMKKTDDFKDKGEAEAPVAKGKGKKA
jgi:hypothetical protein